MRPTQLERFIGMRINLQIFGVWCGTGHYSPPNRRTTEESTDSEASDDSDSDCDSRDGDGNVEASETHRGEDAPRRRSM